MRFELAWTERAQQQYAQLKTAAAQAHAAREKSGKTKSSKQEGLFKQVHKCLTLLSTAPRHPGLQTHEYDSLKHPFSKGEKVFEAYAQNKTPGAYRVFWCYGPERGSLTVIAITPHP